MDPNTRRSMQFDGIWYYGMGKVRMGGKLQISDYKILTSISHFPNFDYTTSICGYYNLIECISAKCCFMCWKFVFATIADTKTNIKINMKTLSMAVVGCRTALYKRESESSGSSNNNSSNSSVDFAYLVANRRRHQKILRCAVLQHILVNKSKSRN